MDKKILEYYVAEYSVLQNSFHCDKLSNVIQTNLSIIEDKTVNDYKIIGIFKTFDEAVEYNKYMKQKLFSNDNK